MSFKDLDRRTAAQIAFAGVDITNDIRPYFLSATYIDNEEDATDDLQIKIQDRDGVWLQKWLASAVDAAAVATAPGSASGVSPTSYRVTPKIGLNVRSGPSTSYKKLGALVCGTVVEVSAIKNGWATIQHNGQTALCLGAVPGVCGRWWRYLWRGDRRCVVHQHEDSGSVFLQQNWNGDGSPRCGMDTMTVRPALSRRVTVSVCDRCGVAEALEDMAPSQKVPLEKWAICKKPDAWGLITPWRLPGAVATVTSAWR